MRVLILLLLPAEWLIAYLLYLTALQEAFIAVQAIDKAIVNLTELYVLVPATCLCLLPFPVISWGCNIWDKWVALHSVYTEYPSPQAELNLTLVQCVKINKDVTLWKTVCFVKVFCPKFYLFSRENHFYFPYGLGTVRECFSNKFPCKLGELLSLWVLTFHKVVP